MNGDNLSRPRRSGAEHASDCLVERRRILTVRDPALHSAHSPAARSGSANPHGRWWDTPAARPRQSLACSAPTCAAGLKLSPFMIPDAIAEHLRNLPYVWPGLRPFLSRFKAYQATAETHYEGRQRFSTACCSATT